MTECPKCASTDIRESRCKTPLEYWRKHLLATTPYRCGRCGWRGWVPDVLPPAVAPAQRQDHADAAVSRPAIGEMAFAAAPPRWDELDFDVLNLPRGPLYSRSSH